MFDMHELGAHWAASQPTSTRRLLATAADVWALSTTAQRQTLVVLLSTELRADPVIIVGALNHTV